MNRKIEFRGIRKDNLNKFIYGFLMSPERINSINEGAVEVMPETVGQYTGLKDCNGVKIFEGDIVESYAYSKAIVVWDEYHAAFDVYCESNAEDDQHFYVNKDIGTDYDIEVIGNIHE